MVLKRLFNYPLKSTRGIALEAADVKLTGLANDRMFVVINAKNKVVTGREYPDLVKLSTEFASGLLSISNADGDSVSLPIPSSALKEIKLFRKTAKASIFDDSANTWISNYLKGDFRLGYIKDQFNALSPERGGEEGEHRTYTDSSPVHLISLSSLNHLNKNQGKNVSARHFRPNIVIDGTEPFEEDSWEEISIGECSFRVQERTARCIFTTIDPKTGRKNKDMEPLAEIAKMRSLKNLPPTFGIGLVPLSGGRIKTGDNVSVTKKGIIE